MEVSRLEQQHADYFNCLFEEGFVDEQFTQLHMLQDESNPDFVKEVVTMYFDDSKRILQDISDAVAKEPIDFRSLDRTVHQFKGSSSSVGCGQVKDVCIALRKSCDDGNTAKSREYCQLLQKTFDDSKEQVEALFELEKQIISGGGTVPQLPM
eukprot:Gb_39959 [translate_table: standard]